MARPARVEYPGALYHVITRGNNRRPVFKDDHDRSAYLKTLFQYCEQKEVELLCYCLLTNHIHLLLRTPQSNLSKMMQPFQTSYTVYFNRRHKHTGHVFEQRYKAFLVDQDNYLLQVSRYIHLNAVGARLVERPRDYCWSSYGAYMKEGKALGLSRALILDQFGKTEQRRISGYRDFVEGGLKRGEKWSELPVIRQAFVGDEDFADEAVEKVKGALSTLGRYRLQNIVRGVCTVTGLGRAELGRAGKEAHTQKGREMLMYLARRHSDASLVDIASYLGVRDISTVSHGVKRAERRIKEEQDFREEIEQVLKELKK